MILYDRRRNTGVRIGTKVNHHRTGDRIVFRRFSYRAGKRGKVAESSSEEVVELLLLISDT